MRRNGSHILNDLTYAVSRVACDLPAAAWYFPSLCAVFPRCARENRTQTKIKCRVPRATSRGCKRQKADCARPVIEKITQPLLNLWLGFRLSRDRAAHD